MKKKLQSESARKFAELHLNLPHPITLADLKFDKDEILTDQDLMQIFGLCSRTLTNHRNKKELSYFKLGGKVFYLKTLLLLDLLKLSND